MSDPSAKEMEDAERVRPSKAEIKAKRNFLLHLLEYEDSISALDDELEAWIEAEIERRMIADEYDKGVPFPKVKK